MNEERCFIILDRGLRIYQIPCSLLDSKPFIVLENQHGFRQNAGCHHFPSHSFSQTLTIGGKVDKKARSSSRKQSLLFCTALQKVFLHYAQFCAVTESLFVIAKKETKAQQKKGKKLCYSFAVLFISMAVSVSSYFFLQKCRQSSV